MDEQQTILARSLENFSGTIWLDGHYAPWNEARLHALSHGLHYATSVWDGMRVYNGRIFKLIEHVQRLYDSATLLGMKIPFSPPDIRDACQKMIAMQNIRNGYIRPIVWRGAETLSLDPAGTCVHMAIAAWEFAGSYNAGQREQGIRLTVSQWKRPPPQTAPWQAKAAGLYAAGVLAKQESAQRGFDDALMLDWRGYIAEVTAANIFLVISGELHTPLPDCFLDGITRRTVIDLARRRGLKIVEHHIEPAALVEADEVFITGTAAELMPVNAVDHHMYKIDHITRQLISDYAAITQGRL